MTTFQSKDAKIVIAHVMGLYSRELNKFESNLWNSIIADFGDESVIRFLIRHCETSVFAPKPAEANLALRPGANNSMAAFEMLARAAKNFGPYRNPRFDDPAIAGAVVLLGGWITVNEQLPDPTSRFDYESYYKRFDAVYKQSCANILLGNGYSQPLLGLHSVNNKKHSDVLELSHKSKSTTNCLNFVEVVDVGNKENDVLRPSGDRL